jgi:hypothetical protein
MLVFHSEVSCQATGRWSAREGLSLAIPCNHRGEQIRSAIHSKFGAKAGDVFGLGADDYPVNAPNRSAMEQTKTRPKAGSV